MLYILETTSTGSGLDCYFDLAVKGETVLVTDSIEKYAKDINRERLSEIRVISHREFNASLETGNWRYNAPQCIMSNSDAYLILAAEASRRLSLPSPAPEDLDFFMNKGDMRRAMIDAGLPTPKIHAVASACDARSYKGTFPVVAKPAKGTGSIGVRLCRDEKELSEWSAEAASVNDRNAGFLLEGFIPGPLYSMELIHRGQGDLVLLGHTNRTLGPPPYFVETSYAFPVQVPEDVSQDVLRQVRMLCVDIQSSMMLHVEYVVDLETGTPKLIEINPRVAGGMLSRMISLSLGESIFVICSKAWTQTPPESVASTYSSGYFHTWKYADRDGEIIEMRMPQAMQGSNYVIDYFVSKKVGDQVAPSMDFRGEILSLLVGAKNSQLAADVGRNIVDSSEIRIREKIVTAV
ncbi:ATP-grasp domain-containing protein [Actibacterium ureilyticum]|uniref:ATP-grasp domain-containing protein n=1 Tax=Actibacterium ureilyticum TaxID=1590614 RepID=UPI000BAAFD48|nr:ATP-grasp domain-containing protein [Actibacterium ureilyticum]